MEIFTKQPLRSYTETNKQTMDREIDEIVGIILDDYNKGRDIDDMNIAEQPDPDKIELIIHELQMILYPGYYREHEYRTRNLTTKIHVLIEDVMYNLRKQIEIALLSDTAYEDTDKATRKRVAQRICLEYFRAIPRMREYLNTDIQATFDGDPAACNKEEIILAYPGLLASSIYRMAHELHLLNVPLLPRMMTEYAHRITGVDIHPGATIGKYFFIDHATGIVVGSTSIIGEHVKVYQGVTIGALSTKLGHQLHGTRRHPTIEDDVTIYSGATILGGNTIIGKGSVIGGNSFVTRSVPPYSTVLTQSEVTVQNQNK
ncbi:serine O-acetyltransferase [Eubacterium sp. AB3007]|uniref:serine O-acetyltransferase n=1 Tax=Eubacterium sp. AB3007 TaxID=1392487 RepID=UPI000690D8BE|nr:serine O-acetyltransferase [Eubacterium sp. AB3007]